MRRLVPIAVAGVALAAGCGGGSVDVPEAETTPTGAVAHSEASRQAPPERSGPRFFAADSVWNARLPAETPADPASKRLVGELVQLVKADRAERRGPWMNARRASTAIYTVPADQPTVRVQLDTDIPDNPSEAFSAIPMPSDAKPSPGGDRRLVVWQPATDRMWELFLVSRQEDGWHARWGGAMRDVSKNAGYFSFDAWPGAQPYWGATATSLPLVGGLITLEDVERGRIDHAVAMSLPEIREDEFAWPAQRTDGRTPGRDAIPQGAHFRLDPDVRLDALGLSPLARMIAEAAQRYGIIVRDKSEGVTFYAEDWTPHGDNPYPDLIGDGERLDEQLAAIPWDRMTLLEMRLCSRRALIAQGRREGVRQAECTRAEG